MKTKILLSFLVAAGVLLAASAADWVQGPSVLWREQCDPVIDAKGVTSAAPVTAFRHYSLSNASTGAVNWIDDGSVAFDMIALGTTTVSVTVGGKLTTVDYATLAALNAQAANDQFALQDAAKAQAHSP